MANTTYTGPVGSAIGATLARNWWAVLLRGIVAVAFGVIALFYTGTTILSLVYVFAFYAVLDGVFAVVSSFRAGADGQRWGFLLFEGIVSILAAVLAVMWPGLTVLAFVGVVAGWSIITGVLELIAAFRLDLDHGRGWLAFAGIVSIIYGGVLIWAPAAGAVVLAWWIGAYAIIFGVSLIFWSFRLKKMAP